MAHRPIFSSRIASILTLIGLAVGLGNVWRFPYMMGQYGGSAFLFIYLVFTILFAVPALMSEMALGRITRKGPIGAFQEIFGRQWGTIIGGMIIFTVGMATSYYAVVIANLLYTSWFSIFRTFTSENIYDFELGLGRGRLQYAITVIAIWGSLFIIYKGLRKGIEPLSKLFVPLFLISFIYLIINALNLEGATVRVIEFLQADFSALKPEHIYAALGQSFFSVGLGGSFMILFGSYLSKNESIPRLALTSTLGDVVAALLAALFIIPTILVFGLDMTSGPTLIFYTLPQLFSQMPGGWLVGSIFLVALSLVALLSLIFALEVIVGSFLDLSFLKDHKLKIILVVGLIECLIALPSAFDSNLIGVLDLIFGSGMMVLGSTLALIGLTKGLRKKAVLDEIFQDTDNRWKDLFYFWIKWVVPIALILVLAGYIYSSFF